MQTAPQHASSCMHGSPCILLACLLAVGLTEASNLSVSFQLRLLRAACCGAACDGTQVLRTIRWHTTNKVLQFAIWITPYHKVQSLSAIPVIWLVVVMAAGRAQLALVLPFFLSACLVEASGSIVAGAAAQSLESLAHHRAQGDCLMQAQMERRRHVRFFSSESKRRPLVCRRIR
jgi:hypothetical protein